MNIDEILNELEKWDYSEVKTILSEIEKIKSDKFKQALSQVTMTKKENGHYIFEYNGYEFEVKSVAYNGRYRVWKRIDGVRTGTKKRGPVVIQEFLGNLGDLKANIRFNSYYNVNLYE